VSPDPPDKIKNIIQITTERTGDRFMVTLLSDARMQVIDSYGLRNEAAAKRGMSVPNPTTYILDKSGTVRWKFTEKNFAVRPTNEMILAELAKLW
jgi:peroxiredoxin